MPWGQRRYVGSPEDDPDHDYKACGSDRDEIDDSKIEKDDSAKVREV